MHSCFSEPSDVSINKLDHFFHSYISIYVFMVCNGRIFFSLLRIILELPEASVYGILGLGYKNPSSMDGDGSK